MIASGVGKRDDETAAAAAVDGGVTAVFPVIDVADTVACVDVLAVTGGTGTLTKSSSGAGGADSGFGVLLPDFGGRFARLRRAEGICGDVDIPSFSDS